MSFMITKQSCARFFKQLLWLMPFICFASGYYAVSFFLHKSVIKTPCVLAKPLDQALQILSHCHLSAQIAATQHNDTVKSSTVLVQYPLPGDSIRPHQTVFLTISSTKKDIAPLCVGKSLETLKNEFHSESISYRYFLMPSNYPQGTCIAQIPAAGKEIENGPVILYIAKNEFFFLTPCYLGQPVAHVASLLEAEHIPYTIFHTQPHDKDHSCNTCNITAQKPLPGSLIQKNHPPTFQFSVNS